MIKEYTKKGAGAWLAMASALVWLLLILVSYWIHHPYYAEAIGEFPNLSLALFILAAVASAAFWLRLRGLKASNTVSVRGLTIYGFILVLQFGVLVLYQSKYSVFTEGLGIIKFLLYSMLLHAAFFVVVLIHYTLGQVILRRLANWYHADSQKLLSLALGMSISGFGMVLLGLAGLLKPWLLWLLFAGILAWQRRAALEFVRQILWQPVRIKEDKPLWHLPVLGILGVFSVLSIAAVKAYPSGFDGSSLYQNIAHLTAQYQALPEGGQAYYGSLFMSLGELLFGLEAVSILLSHFAILFCLFALYRIARLFLNRRYAWLTVLSFYVIPAFNFHSIIDEKIDLLFLFVSLSALLLILEYRVRLEAKANPPTEGVAMGWGTTEAHWILAAAGWLAGYSFGIKYLGVLSICGLLAFLVYQRVGTRAGVGALALLTAGLFGVGIHQFAYVSMDGSSPLVIAGLAGILGLGLLTWAFSKNLNAFRPTISRLALFAAFAVIPFLPWAGKHLIENGKLSLSSIVQGASPTPKILIGWGQEDFNDPLDKLLKILKERDVELNAAQLSQAQNIADRYAFEGSSEEKKQQVFKLRDQVIETVLDETQQRKALSSQQHNLSTQDMSPDGERAYQLIVDRFAERDVTLSAQQQVQLKGMLADLDMQVLRIEERKLISANLRERAFNEVLSPQQREVLEGRLKASELLPEGDYVLSGAQREEIKRYVGYEPGFPLYLSMPYDLTMNTNVPFAQYLDISILFLVFIGLLCFTTVVWKQVLIIMGLVFFWIFSVCSLYQKDGVVTMQDVQTGMQAFFAEHPQSLGSATGSIYVAIQKASVSLAIPLHGLYQWMSSWGFLGSFVGVLMVTALLGLLFRQKLQVLPANFKGGLAYMLAVGFLWLLLGNAIVWYAFPVFALLTLWFIYYLKNPAELFGPQLEAFSGRYLWSVLSIVLFLGVALKFYNPGNPKESRQLIYNAPFLKHTGFASDREKVLRSFRPFLAETIATINRETDSRVFRVGTFFNYHIEQNDQRVLEDNQLEQYDRTTSQLSNKEEFLQILKDNGFRYVLFDMNIHSMDRTPEKSLTAKAKDLFDLLYFSPQAQLRHTDNIIKDASGANFDFDGQKVSGRPGFSKDVLYPGTYVLYELVD